MTYYINLLRHDVGWLFSVDPAPSSKLRELESGSFWRWLCYALLLDGPLKIIISARNEEAVLRIPELNPLLEACWEDEEKEKKQRNRFNWVRKAKKKSNKTKLIQTYDTHTHVYRKQLFKTIKLVVFRAEKWINQFLSIVKIKKCLPKSIVRISHHTMPYKTGVALALMCVWFANFSTYNSELLCPGKYYKCCIAIFQIWISYSQTWRKNRSRKP